MIEHILSYAGLVLAVMLGYLVWIGQSRTAIELHARESWAVKKQFRRLESRIRLILSVITFLLAITGFVSALLSGNAARDSLIILHTVAGALFILVWIPFIILRAAGMGLGKLIGGGREMDSPHAATIPPGSCLQIAAFWVIVLLGLLLVVAVLGIFISTTSQAAQSCLVRTHLIAAFLFLVSFGIFTWMSLRSKMTNVIFSRKIKTWIKGS
jgi:hypothetical protein